MTKLFLRVLRFILLPVLPMPLMAAGLELYNGETDLPEEPPIEALTPFKTSLVLTPQQKEDMEFRAQQRIKEIMDEMGLDVSGDCTPGAWMDHRIKNQLVYDNELEWRKAIIGGVFKNSNMTRGVTKRFTREMAAKVSDDMIGTKPFFGAVKRTQGDDAKLARGVEEFAQDEVDRSNLPIAIREGQRSALVRNEAVIKVRHVEIASSYRGPATVMVDGIGAPIKTKGTGEFIYEGDNFAPDPAVEGLYRLKKDPTFEMKQGEYVYAYFDELQQETIRKRGLEAHVLDSRSFLCPLTAPDIHSADINVQLLDMEIGQIQSIYGQYEEFTTYCNARTSGESQPKEGQGESRDGALSTHVRTVRIAECYMRFDADGDGFEEEIFLVLDLDTKKAVFFDYLENHFHKRPFEVIPGVETVPNRWYGIGVIQQLWDQNLYVDAQFNRINLKDSREASATFANTMSVKEWKNNGAIKLGTDYIYTMETGFDLQNPPIFRVNLNEVSELGERLMATSIQDMTTSFGVISAKDASAADLNNSRTATGIINMERTANILTRYTEIAQEPGITALLKQSVVIALEHMPPMKMFFSKDGNVLHTLNKQEARAIEQDVRLYLTRARSMESLALNQQALAIAKDYFATMKVDPESLISLRDLYVAQLKALEVQGSDEILPVIDDAYMQKWNAERAAAMQAQVAMENTPPKEIINYKDAPPSVQAQLEADAGMTPAPLAERTKWRETSKPKPPEKKPDKKPPAA